MLIVKIVFGLFAIPIIYFIIQRFRGNLKELNNFDNCAILCLIAIILILIFG